MKTVLVVDDEPVIQSLVASSLGGPDCAVHAVADGPSALASIAVRRPDLILLDLALPGMSGAEVARRLKSSSKTAQIPILYLTGLPPADHAPAEGIILKPFTPATLRVQARAWLS